MKSRYDNAPGKDAAIANTRQKRYQAEHSEKDTFVKSHQAKYSSMAGRPPEMEEKNMKFDAYMSNNGMHAQELALKLTEGLDKLAYPMNPNVVNDE